MDIAVECRTLSIVNEMLSNFRLDDQTHCSVENTLELPHRCHIHTAVKTALQ